MKASLCLVLATVGLLGRVVAAQQPSVSQADLARQQLTPQQKEVWDREKAYFGYLQTKDLDGFMSLWHERFVGWPDYSEHPVRKPETRASVAEEFHNNPNRQPGIPTPEEVETFGDVAITHYVWPASSELAKQKFRVTHTWIKDRTEWRIIGGMSCDVSSIAGMTSLRGVATTTQEPQQKLKMPGPEAQNLMLGTWSTKVHYPPSPATSQGEVAEGTEIWRPGPGGRSVIEEYREKNSKGEVEGLGVEWWDEDAQGRRFLWCENDLASGCYVSKGVAKWDGGNLVWKEAQEAGGVKRAYAETFREIKSDSFLQELQEGDNLQNLQTTAMITATRINSMSMESHAAVSESDFRASVAKRQQAMIEGDEAMVDRMTAKEYAQTDILGHVQDKSAWMAEYFRPLAALTKAGKFRWERYDERDVRVVMLGDTAVVTGELAMKGTGAKFTQGKWEEAPGTSIEGTFRFTRVWVKRDGSWLLVALHNSAPLGVQTARP